MKFKKCTHGHLGEVFMFHCPGCGYCHWVREHGRPSWNISGVEIDSPTVSPSILVRGKYRCHSFVREGRIQFLSDCTHSLAGKTMDIPDFDR